MTKQKDIEKELDLLIDAFGDTSNSTEEELDAVLKARGIDPNDAVTQFLEIAEKHEKNARTAWQQCEEHRCFICNREVSLKERTDGDVLWDEEMGYVCKKHRGVEQFFKEKTK